MNWERELGKDWDLIPGRNRIRVSLHVMVHSPNEPHRSSLISYHKYAVWHDEGSKTDPNDESSTHLFALNTDRLIIILIFSSACAAEMFMESSTHRGFHVIPVS